jgi:hypothetical protein
MIKKVKPAIIIEENTKVLEKLEEEFKSPQRRRKNNPAHKEINSLTAKEEKHLRKRRVKAKLYDGRLASRNGAVSLLRVREALDGFYKSVKLPELKEALEVGDNPRYLMLLAAINNPRFNNMSFPELCRRCKMSLLDVLSVWRSHVQNQGIARMMEHLPDIMEDVAVDSKSRTVVCHMCQGEGKLHDSMVNKVKGARCPECHGDGTVRLLGDKDARNLAFETVGLRKSGGGINVNVQQNNNNSRGVPSMEDQITDIDKIFDAEYSTNRGEETDSNDDHGEAGISTDTKEVEENRDPAADADARWDSADSKDYTA